MFCCTYKVSADIFSRIQSQTCNAPGIEPPTTPKAAAKAGGPPAKAGLPVVGPADNLAALLSQWA